MDYAIICDELKFDPNHYCKYYITSETQNKKLKVYPSVGILYPGSQKFVKAIDILNRRVLAGDSKVLIDAFFVDRFERNAEAWQVDCKYILEPEILISKEIQKLYKIDQLLEIKKLKSISWTQALREGKFWPYAQLKWQSLYSQYKKPLLGGIAVGGAGLAAWYLSKYGKDSWLPSFKTQRRISAPRPAQQ